MNSLDRAGKESKIFLDHAKDSVTQRLVDIAKSVNLSEDQLRNVVSMVVLTLEESYQKVLPHYQNSIKNFMKK